MSEHEPRLKLVEEFQINLWGRNELCRHLLLNTLNPGIPYVGVISLHTGEVARFTAEKSRLLEWFDSMLPPYVESDAIFAIYTQEADIQFGAARTYEVRDYGESHDAVDDDYATVLTGASWDAARTWVDKQERPDLSNLVIHAESPPPFKVICVVLWDRAYGGPEEGGWWYDTVDPNDHEAQWLTHEAGGPWLIRNDEQASERLHWLDKLLAEKAVNEGRHSPNSVLSQGHYKAHCFDGWPVALPQVKPHYE